MGKRCKLCIKITIKPIKIRFNKKKAVVTPLKCESSEIVKCPASDSLNSFDTNISQNKSIDSQEYCMKNSSIDLNVSIETLKATILVKDENEIMSNNELIDLSGPFLPRDTELKFSHDNPFRVKDLTLNLKKMRHGSF